MGLVVGSSQTRDHIGVPYNASWILNHWTTRDTHGHGLQGLRPGLLVPEVQGARHAQALRLLRVQVDAEPRVPAVRTQVLELQGPQGGAGWHQQGRALPAILGASHLQSLGGVQGSVQTQAEAAGREETGVSLGAGATVSMCVGDTCVQDARGSSFRARPRSVCDRGDYADHTHLLGRRRPVGSDFLDVTPGALVTKQQIGNLGYFRIKNMCVSKDPTNRMKT